jgi:hypothetical protein
LRDAILATRDTPPGEQATAWRERFTPHDDGHAGDRVVQRMLELGWLPPAG